MSTVSGARRASRRQGQDVSTDKVVVNLDASSPAVGSRRGASVSVGALASPIDVEALDDEVQAVSPSQVPPQRRNRRTRRQPVTVVDLEAEINREGVSHSDVATASSHSTGNKRQRVTPVVHCLSPDRGEGISFQNNVVNTSTESAKVAPKKPTFTCPVCWNKLEEPSTTICGHIFCTKCIKTSIQFQKKCPTCRRSLRMNNFHRIYLPEAAD